LVYLLSVWAGLMRIGVTGSLSIPQDYIARDAAGILIILVGLASLLSPVLAAWLLGCSLRQARQYMLAEVYDDTRGVP